jgi:hypothetical protein
VSWKVPDDIVINNCVLFLLVNVRTASFIVIIVVIVTVTFIIDFGVLYVIRIIIIFITPL